MHLQGCLDLCDTAPSRFVGASGTVINTGTARFLRVMIVGTAGMAVSAIEWSDDGVTFETCDVDLTAVLGDTSTAQLISLCLDAKKAFLRVTFTGTGNLVAELYGLRDIPADCGNDLTVEKAVECSSFVAP